MSLRVGLLDSGIDPGAGITVAAGRGFGLNANGKLDSFNPGPDISGHGTALARIIGAVPDIEILNAQVFKGEGPTSAAVVAGGLDWLVQEGAQLVSMSFGLAPDREVLRTACERALGAGVILLGASPARGAPVFPSAYPGVIRVTGDARCGPGEFSALHSAQADIGAFPDGGGASFAVAHVAAEIARWWPDTGRVTTKAVIAHLQDISRYHGPERRR